ncbi:MAG: signal peptidase I [Kiritimatiellaceae bacterium]|nr:signal peptidase I [Kiritimatiellaceae bacterium]
MRTGEQVARAARKSGEGELMEVAGTAVIKACENVAPPKKHPKVRENVEVLFVAIAAAMAIRAYFLQPFKIPTGSMQPTLYGITVQAEPAIKANNPLATIANMVLFGEKHSVVPAKTSGFVRTINNGTKFDLQATKSQSEAIFFINNLPHKVPINLWHEQEKHFLQSVANRYIKEGEILFDGIIKSGDYILVNRIKYNFVRPKRGDIAVFDTRELTHPQVRKDAYYIKRMVGLPGETISIAPKYLLINGEKPTDPRFDKLFNNPKYNGYQFGGGDAKIRKLGDSMKLGNDEYLFFGDNTLNSLDGRYFGAVNRRQILGPAFFVCWPFDRAGFADANH